MQQHGAWRWGIFGLLALAFSLSAADKTKLKPMYTVSGERHGVSFFPLVDYPETKPMVEGEMDFLHYHKYAEVVSFLNKWAKDYPDIVDVYSVGQTYEGREIWQMTISNKATGKDTDKPAMFLEGNRHSGEVIAAESALYFAWQVLSKYGRDPEITHLVDTKALYIRVKNNPDGSELYLNTAQSNRSTVRPHDDDGDGLLDEDAAEDLDGDGLVFQMRKKMEQGQGNYVIDPADRSGRVMKKVGKGKGNYLVYSEGVDNDNDGKYNEDEIGGLDLHRNYPENWRPEPALEKTGRGMSQTSAGPYPLSEPETRAVFLFLLQHPNVSIGQTMDATVPMHLRPPSTSKSEESMIAEDLALYRYFDKQGKNITGYRDAGDLYWDSVIATRDYEDEETQKQEIKGRPLFGQSLDFGYFSYGSIWYGDELWSGGKVVDYNKDGRVDDLETLRWNDEALGGRGFKKWTKYEHPQLGEVEIGGFNPKFLIRNPPVEFLEEWARKEALFNLFLAKSLPQVKIISAVVRPVKNESDVYEVTAVFTNQGFLPTALEMAKRVKMVAPDRAEISFDDKVGELVEGKKSVELGSFKSGEKKEARWKIRTAGTDGVEVEIAIVSTRGGVEKKRVKLI